MIFFILFFGCVCVNGRGKTGWAADNGGDGGNGVQRLTPRVEKVEDEGIMETRGIVQR